MRSPLEDHRRPAHAITPGQNSLLLIRVFAIPAPDPVRRAGPAHPRVVTIADAGGGVPIDLRRGTLKQPGRPESPSWWSEVRCLVLFRE